MLFDYIESDDWSVWGVVLGNLLIATHTGPPELYVSPFPDEVEISLIQYSKERGVPKLGDIWTGERFIKNV